MPVFINAKGTSINQFQLGKKGSKLYGGDSRPAQGVQLGEIWLDKANGAISIAREGAGEPVFQNLITKQDITKQDIDALNVDAATLGDVSASDYARTDTDETFTGNVTIQGTLFFDSTTIIESNTIAVGDNIIVLNNDVDEQTAPTQDAGISINRGSATDVSLLWDETADRWSVGEYDFAASNFVGNLTGDVTGNVTADTITVNAVTYTGTDGLAGAVLTTTGSGTTSFSKLEVENFKDEAWVATGETWEDDDSHFASTGAITDKIDSYGFAVDADVVHLAGAETISGDKTFTGTVTIGGISYPTADGNVGQTLTTDGNGVLSFSNIVATPGGLDTQIQFNDGGVLNGTANLVYQAANAKLVAANLTVENHLTLLAPFNLGNIDDPASSSAVYTSGEPIYWDGVTGNTSSISETVIDSFSAAQFRSARYTVQITNNTSPQYYITDMLVIHDGSTVYLTQYNEVATGNVQATFDADIVEGQLRLLATPSNSDDLDYRVVRQSIQL